MRGSKGYFTRARHLLKKKSREKGKPKLSKLLYEYELGTQVIIRMDPSVQKSLPHKRYHGKIGTLVEKRGRGYVVSVSQGEAIKLIIVRPEHIEPYGGA